MSLDLSWWLFFPFKKQKWWKNERKEHFPSARVGLKRKLFSSCAAGQTLPTVSPFWLAQNTAFLAFRLPSCLTVTQISPRGGVGWGRGRFFSLSLFFPGFAEDSEASYLYPNNHSPKEEKEEKKILTPNSPWQAILSFFFFLERYFIGNTSSPSLETQAWGLGPVSEHQFEDDFKWGFQAWWQEIASVGGTGSCVMGLGKAPACLSPRTWQDHWVWSFLQPAGTGSPQAVATRGQGHQWPGMTPGGPVHLARRLVLNIYWTCLSSGLIKLHWYKTWDIITLTK